MRMLRLAAAILAISGCAGHGGPAAPPPAPATEAPPRAAPATEAPPPPAPAAAEQRVALCVIQERKIVMVEGVVHPETGDTLVGGRAWREAYPEDRPPYAAANRWYVEGSGLRPPGRRYPMDKYGLPRVLSPGDLTYWGEYQGLPVFVEAGNRDLMADVAYVPVRPGCEFQPYQQVTNYGGVRGR